MAGFWQLVGKRKLRCSGNGKGGHMTSIKYAWPRVLYTCLFSNIDMNLAIIKTS